MKLDTRIEIAPGANPAAAPSTFAWESAGRRRAAADIAITTGRDDEATQTEAGSMTTTMDDRGGDLSPRNVLGKWYGQLSNGTPVRVLLDRAEDDFATGVVTSGGLGVTDQGFAWASQTSGGYLSNDGTRGVFTSPDVNTAATTILQQTGSPDVEIVWSTRVPVVPTGDSFRSGALARYADSSNYLRPFIRFEPGGTISAWVQRRYQGATTEVAAAVGTGVTYVAGDTVHAKLRVDGPYVMLKAWKGSIEADEPDSWALVGTDNTLDAAGVGLMFWRPNNNAGAYTAYVSYYSVTNILWQGAIPEWPKRWPDKSGVDATTPIAAAGVLRRLQQGKSPLVSPLRRQLLGQPYMSYFPLEDDSGATVAASAVSRQSAATVVDVSFAGEGTLAGSATAAVMNTQASSRISGPIASRVTTDGYAAMWFFKLETLPAAEFPLMELRATGTVTRWLIYLNGTAYGIKGYDRDGGVVVDTANAFGMDPTKWVAMQLETNVSGGTVNWALITHAADATAFFASSGSYSGSAPSLTSFTMTAPTNNTAAAHLWFGDNDLPFVDGTFAQVANGYRGELAGARIARLCAENGVPAWVLSGSTEPMGRQKVAKLVELLRECEAADQGILYERGLALAYIPRVRRYNIKPSMALSWPGLFDEPPEPQDDDQRLRNQWTVTRTDGSSATVSDEDSIEADGLYDDAIELNIRDDERLLDFAGWFTSLGTAKYLRWPRITINFMAHPELIGQWLGVRVGSRITIADPPSQIAGEVIDLVVEGINTTINLYKWTVEIACAPAQPWQIGTYDDEVIRYDVDSYTEIPLNSTATWCPVICRDRMGFWSWVDPPYEVSIAGQANRVIGMSRPDSAAIADGSMMAGTPGPDGWYALQSGGSNFTPSVVSDRAFGSGYSIAATVTGSPAQLIIRNGTYRPVAVPGQTYEVSAWVKRSAAGNVTLTLDYLNSSAAWFALSSTVVAVAADTWTYVTFTATVPAGTAFLEYGPTLGGSPAAGTTVKVHNIDIIRTDTRNSRQLALLQRGIDGFVKSLPPGEDFRIRSQSQGRYGI